MSKTIHLAIISGTFPPMRCGVGDYTGQLAGQLAGQGIKVSVITSQQAGAAGDEVDVLPVVKQWDKQGLKTVVEKCGELAPDLILMQWPTAVYGRSLAVNLIPKALKQALPQIPLLATLHELRYFKFWTRWRLHWLYKACDHIILVDPKDEPFLPSYVKAKAGHIPIGSNIPVASSFDVSAKRKELGFESDDLVVTFFGFANPPKKLDVLTEALAEMNDQHIKFLLLSDLNKQYAYQSGIKRFIQNGPLKSRTRIIPDQPPQEVARLLSLADIAVLPFADGLSLKRGTMMACLVQGLPVITTIPEDGLPPGVEHGKNCWLIKGADKQSIVQAIKTLSADRTKMAKIGQGAKELARQFDWVKIAEQHNRIFQKLMVICK